MDGAPLLTVVATVNLPGLKRGAVALVVPTVPYVRQCLEAQFLVPVKERSKGDD